MTGSGRQPEGNVAPRVTGIFRYPVKGMSAEALDRVELQPGETLPLDRRFALALADSPFDPDRPVWLRKTHFLMLMRDERLAALDVVYSDPDRRVTVRQDGRLVAEADLETAEGRNELERLFQDLLDLPAKPRLVEALGHAFTDAPEKLVSLINLATVRAIQAVAGQTIQPARFRANLHVDGLPAWAEFGWVGGHITIGEAEFEVVARIDRCAATNVEPGTGRRDINLPALLRRRFGHIDCGVLLRVTAGGSVSRGDVLAARSEG
jgi:uncharacterized protein YcbX